jgi:hypothetical protein
MPNILALSQSSLYFRDFPDWLKENRSKQSYVTASTGKYLESASNKLSNLESFWLADVVDILNYYPSATKTFEDGATKTIWYHNKDKDSVIAMTRTHNVNIVIAHHTFVSKHLRIYP